MSHEDEFFKLDSFVDSKKYEFSESTKVLSAKEAEILLKLCEEMESEPVVQEREFKDKDFSRDYEVLSPSSWWMGHWGIAASFVFVLAASLWFSNTVWKDQMLSTAKLQNHSQIVGSEQEGLESFLVANLDFEQSASSDNTDESTSALDLNLTEEENPYILFLDEGNGTSL